MKKLLGLFSQYKGLRREVYILFIGRIVTSMGSMVWPMFTMILSLKLGLDAEKIALLMVASGVFMLPADLIGGKLADHCSKKKIILWCDIVSVVCYVVCGLIPIGWATVALMLAAAVSQTMEHPAYSGLFADMTKTKDRQRAFSLSYLGVNLGLVLSPTIAGLLFKDHLWLSFIISGAAIGVSTVLIEFCVKNIHKEPDDSGEAVYQKERHGEGILRILRDNRILLIYIAAAAIYGAVYSQYSYLMPLDMSAVHGEDGAVIFGTVSSLNCLIVVLFTPIFTKLFAKTQDLFKLLAGQLFVGLGYALFLTLIGHIPVYYAAMLLFTWGEIFATLADGPYLTKRIPSSHRGRITGLISVCSAVIAGAIELTVGHLYKQSGHFPAWTFVLSMLGAAILLTAVLLFADRRAYPKLYEMHGEAAPSADESSAEADEGSAEADEDSAKTDETFEDYGTEE